MNRPSKKDIRTAIEKLKAPPQSPDGTPEFIVPNTSGKKPNKNRIRKKGSG